MSSKEIKDRIREFIMTIEFDPSAFGSTGLHKDDFFTNEIAISLSDIVDLLIAYPALNINWILTGWGKMLFSNEEIVINALEDELAKKQAKIDELERLIHTLKGNPLRMPGCNDIFDGYL